MADWQRELNLSDLWAARENGEITIKMLGDGIAERLRCLRPFGDDDLDYDREDIADEFEFLPGDADTDDFDEIMERLYDWADTSLDGEWNGRKVCWVRTVF